MLMKIKDARAAYTAQIDILRGRQQELLRKKEENDKRLAESMKHETVSGDGGVVLNLSEEYRKRAQDLQARLDGIREQIDEHIELRDKVIDTEVGIANAEASKQQGEAMQEYGEEMAKCLEIARRISNGDKVPATDEKKLIDFNMEIYMAAKNMAVMNMDKKHKEHESLWGDEEEKEAAPDPREMAENTEISVDIPEIDLAQGAAE